MTVHGFSGVEASAPACIGSRGARRHTSQRRSRFFSPSRFLLSMRRSTLPRVGFVLRRTFGFFAAIDTSVLRRVRHASRLSACERVE